MPFSRALGLTALISIAACSCGTSNAPATDAAIEVSDGVVTADAGAPPEDANVPDSGQQTVSPNPSSGCNVAFTRPSYDVVDGKIQLPIETPPGLGQRAVRPYISTSYQHSTDDPRPVLFFLHGGGGNAQIQFERSTLQQLADEQDILLFMPDGTNRQGNAIPRSILTWNAGGCCPPATANLADDVSFINDVLDWVEANYCVDKNRLFVGGFSNGGMMTYRLGCELSERFAAAAAISGPDMTAVGYDGRAPVGCARQKPLPLLHIHGTADQTAPYLGGKGPCFADNDLMRDVEFRSAEESARGWSQSNGCLVDNQSPWLPGALVSSSQSNPCVNLGCDDEREVVLCSLPGSGHSFPQTEPALRCDLDAPTAEWFDASDAMWRFFEAHPRRP